MYPRAQGDDEAQKRLRTFVEYRKLYGLRNDQKGERRRDGWRPMRYCEDDWILCVWVERWTRLRYDIAFFLAEDHERFVRCAGVMGGLIFLLSQAYNQLGKMEVRFIGPPEGHEPDIPASIREVATNLGVTLGGHSIIYDGEGRQIYARLTGLSLDVETILTERNIDLLRTCFIVQRRIWGALEMEHIAKRAFSPARVLNGGIGAEHRISYQHEYQVLRLALTSERIRIYFQNEAKRQGNALVRQRWVSETEQELIINQAVTLSSVSGSPIHIHPSSPFIVHLWPSDSTGYIHHFPQHLQILRQREGEVARIVAVTQDFYQVPLESRDKWLKSLARCAGIISFVDTLLDLDEEIAKRLARSFSTARAMPELPD